MYYLYNKFKTKEIMKKSDLKTGTQVELRDGSRCVVLLDTPAGDALCDIHNPSYLELNSLNKDLTDTYYRNNDIVKVYVNNKDMSFLRRFDDKYLVWERKEEKVIATIDGVDYSESTLRSLIKKATS